MSESVNEHSNLSEITREVKKKVYNFLVTYFFLIVGTVLLFLVILGVVGLIAYALFLGEISFDYRILIIMVMVILAAGVCVKMVLDPLFKLFERRNVKGREIKRNEYPELFTMIDEIVSKADCLSPKHVYISNECNAYVFYPSILGYMFHGAQNLTIGLPLLMTMNKSELKAILSHEFGHFTQKSVSTNRVANLSEFICASIDRSRQEIENEDDLTSVKMAKGFARFATRIMTRQYLKVAPYNGILSRAQEFDADSYSRQIAGTAAAVSSLSKLSYFSVQWSIFDNYLHSLIKEEKRVPESIKAAADIFVENFNNNKTDLKLVPEYHFSKPKKEFASRISWANNDTHPSTEDRCEKILSLPAIETHWDDCPALSFFSNETVNSVFNELSRDIKNELFPMSTVFVKNNVTESEVNEALNRVPHPVLSWFYCSSLFCSKQGYVSGKEDHPEYDSFPFTEQNALTLQQFYNEENDYRTLQGIVQERSNTTFYYNGVQCTAKNVPIDQQKVIFDSLFEKASDVARHCNWWLSRRADADTVGYSIETLLNADLVLADLESIRQNIVYVNSLLYSYNNSTKVRQFIDETDVRFRKAVHFYFQSEESIKYAFAPICKEIGLSADVFESVVAYFLSETRKNDKMLVDTYANVYDILSRFRNLLWGYVKSNWILPVMEGKADGNVSSYNPVKEGSK